jgi:hypothetical protein
MITYKSDEWIPMCRRMLAAGIGDVPNGHIVDTYRVGNELFFMIDFDTEADELMFCLKWA